MDESKVISVLEGYWGAQGGWSKSQVEKMRAAILLAGVSTTGDSPQIVSEHGDPNDYCMGCDHYHDPHEGCAIVDKLERGYVIVEGGRPELDDGVLVEGSWFDREALPTILGNYIRSSEAYARDAKNAHTKISDVVNYIETDPGIDMSEAMPGRIILDMLVHDVSAYVANVEPDSDRNLTLIREAMADATELRRHDDDMSQSIADLLVDLANALAAREVSASDRKTVETDTSKGLNAWVPDFLKQPQPPKGLSLDSEAEGHEVS